jgi:hypothetical protein
MPSYHGRRISSVGLRIFFRSCSGRIVGNAEVGTSDVRQNADFSRILAWIRPLSQRLCDESGGSEFLHFFSPGVLRFSAPWPGKGADRLAGRAKRTMGPRSGTKPRRVSMYLFPTITITNTTFALTSSVGYTRLHAKYRR